MTGCGSFETLEHLSFGLVRCSLLPHSNRWAWGMSWTQDNKRRIESLVGCEVAQALIVEMAMIEEGPDGLPIFRIPALPFVQCHLIELVLDDGRVARLSNYQNEMTFGICVEFNESFSIDNSWSLPLPGMEGAPSIYRAPDDIRFPLGEITMVNVGLDENMDATQIEMTISGSRILLKAGEIIEDCGGFTIAEQDESVLLFLRADDVSSVRFSPERYQS